MPVILLRDVRSLKTSNDILNEQIRKVTCGKHGGEDGNLHGFILRNGEFIPIDDAERMFEQARILLETPREVAAMMWDLARECTAKRRYMAAQACFEKALNTSEDDDTKVRCLLSIGQLKERQGDYSAALAWYRKAFDLQPGADVT
ncbi:hypothetical protein ES708_25067 [subsurface metagenome]